MTDYCIPLIEPWNYPVQPSLPERYFNSNYSNDKPLFVAFHYSWVLTDEIYDSILSYVENFEQILCAEHKLDIRENFKLIVDNSGNGVKLRDEMNHKYGYEMVTLIDFFALRSVIYESDHPPTVWNSKSDRSLILFGKMSREYRCDILKDLVADDKLRDDQVLWSLELSNPSPIVTDNISKVIDVDKYKDYERLPDQVEYKKHTYQGYLGYPYRKELYTDTFMSTILETCGSLATSNAWFLSEKTWRVVANKHPFIAVIHEDINQRLEDQGINTFREFYLNGKEYIQDDVIENFSLYYTRLRDYIKSHPEEIQNIVDNNYRAYENIVQQDLNRIPWLFDTPLLMVRKITQKVTPLSMADALMDLEFYQYRI